MIKSLIKKTTMLNVNESQQVIIDCQIAEKEQDIFQISWSFNETFRLEREKSTRLKINDVNINQAGVYECYAETPANTYLTSVHLNVSPLPVQVETKLKKISANKGSSVILDCTWWFLKNELFDNSLLKFSVTKWKFNNTIIDEEKIHRKFEFLDPYKTVLKIKDLELNETNTLYSCLFYIKNFQLKISNFSLFVGGNFS